MNHKKTKMRIIFKSNYLTHLTVAGENSFIIYTSYELAVLNLIIYGL